MLIGVASGIPYRAFFAALAPVALIGLIIDFLVIALVYRRELALPFTARAEPRARLHPFLTLKSLAASVAMIAWFFAGANVSMVAFTAGAALLLTRRVKPEKVFLEINWNLLTLFAGLFVVVVAARAASPTLSSTCSTPGKAALWPPSPRPSPCCRTSSPTYRR